VRLHSPSAAGNYMVDIAIGAAGSEIVILSDLYWAPQTNAGPDAPCRFFPISIPAGVRISARCQSPNAAATLYAGVMLLADGFMPSPMQGRVTTYGATEATTRGVNVNAGAVAHTTSAWVQVVASLTNPARMLGIAAGMGNQGHGGNGVRDIFDIGIGGAGSEIVIIPDCLITASLTLSMPDFFIFPVNIPSGTRLAIRMQSSTTTSTDRQLDFVCYGVD
jgi:hypothetical protein